MSSSTMTPKLTAMWHRVDVRRSSALGRTEIRVLGSLDRGALETIDDAIAVANAEEHVLTFRLGEMSSISPDALAMLLAPDLTPARVAARRRAARHVARAKPVAA